MASNATIRPQQIERAKKLLQNLPEKEDRKTRSEAAELLERDFKKAKEKGYSPKELSQMLKNEGIIIPAYLDFLRKTEISPSLKNRKQSLRKNKLRKRQLLSCSIL